MNKKFKSLGILLVVLAMGIIGYGIGYYNGIRSSGEACKISMSMLAGKVAVLEAKHLDMLRDADSSFSLLKTIIEQKIEMVDILEKHLSVLVDKETIQKDKAMLYLRLGIIHQKNGDNDISKQKYNLALKLYNSTQESDITLKDLKNIYQKLNKDGAPFEQ